jgi:hypothetical protein
LICLIFYLPAPGQSPEQAEKELVAHLKDVEKWLMEPVKDDESILQKDANIKKDNAAIKKTLLKVTKQPSALKYGFSELAKYMSISTSEDGKFRIYSWDTAAGGTMHFYKNVYQYEGKGGRIFSKIDDSSDNAPSGFYSDIFTMNTAGGPVYLARCTWILSNPLAYQSIGLFRIANNLLDANIRLIKTPKGMENSVGIEYDFFSVVDRKERPLKLVLFDKLSRSIQVPVVVDDTKFPNGGRVTEKFDTYRFDGRYFVKVN